MSTFTQDVRLALRVMGKSPSFTAIAVSALALGIGANTAIFSVVSGVLLQPLPFKDPDRLMTVGRSFKDGGLGGASVPKYMVWRQTSQVFDAMTAYDFAGPGLNLSTGDKPEQVKGIHVSAEFFEVFGATPFAGRTFSKDEDRPGGPRLAVISYVLWKRHWGGDPNVIGRPIVLNGEPFTLAGVLGHDFHSYPPADIWIPLQADPNSVNQGHYLRVAARLKPGVSLQTAKAQLKMAGERFRQIYPRWIQPDESVTAIPMKEDMVGDTKPALFILFGAVGFVLLIACANVANLLLARAASRAKEIAIRTALGAGRLRLVRQLLTESVMLSALSGVLGLVIGVWGVRALLSISPGDLPRIAELTEASFLSTIDYRMLGFTLGISVLTGVLFGLVPALQLSKPDLNSTLKETSSRSTTGRHHYARSVLVVSEVALALVLVIGAGLLIRTFVSLRAVNGGFDPHNMLTLQVSLNGERYGSTARVEVLTRKLLERIESLPGVVAATTSLGIPLEGGADMPFNIEGRAPVKGNPFHGDEQWRWACPDHFKALKVPLLRGRVFTLQDTAKAPAVLIINETMAKKYWPKQDPIGQRVTIGKGLGPEFADPTRQIIGVVGDVRENGLNTAAPSVMYVPMGQVPDGLTQLANRVSPTSWIIRTAVNPLTLVQAISREFLAVDNDMPPARVRTMEQVISEVTARQNFNMLLLAIFAAIALLLAAIGIYGVMSYAVEQRTHEIGIRMALGAGTPDMLRLVVIEGMRLAGIGVVVGLLTAFGLARLLAKLLFGVKPTDPPTYVAVALILSAVAFIACYIPARRASRVDPLIALRYE